MSSYVRIKGEVQHVGNNITFSVKSPVTVTHTNTTKALFSNMLGLVYLFILYANRNIAFYILQLFLHEKFVFQMHVSSKPADLPSSCRLRVSVCHLTTLRLVEVSRIDIQVTTGRFGLVRALMNLTLLLTVWLYLKAKHLTSRLSFKLLNIKANGGSSVCRFGTFHHDTINSASVQLSWVAQ